MTDDLPTPALLTSVRKALAQPSKLKREAAQRLKKVRRQHPDWDLDEIRRAAAQGVIASAGNWSAAVGGVTALPGAIPGAGTVVAVSGGLADVAMTMKFQVEMAMTVAVIYGHDIGCEEVQLTCMLLAASGNLQEGARKSATAVGTKAVTNLVKENLKGALLRAVKTAFAKLGLRFSRKALEKSIPLFVGVFVSMTANKGLTHVLGKTVQTFFSSGAQPDELLAGAA